MAVVRVATAKDIENIVACTNEAFMV